ncbi:DNA-binding transcriptional LysR family regulator [Nitrobacteraceae bacterium AZCC 2161]
MDIFALKIYSRVARLHSFSAAARELSISQSQASRAVSDLEAELGALLLARTTRAVVPTEAGVEYLARVESVLDQLDEAEQSVRQDELRGTLRISMPTSAGIREIIARLPRFTDRHPRLNLQILLDDKRNDLVREAVDVAIRIGTLPDSNATARLLTTYPRLIVASPDYLERAGLPLRPADLPQHRIVHGPASAVETAWTFSQDGKTVNVQVEPNISFSDNEGAVAATVAGMGITSIGYWTCRRELAEGTLKQILAGWETVPTRVHAYFPLGRATRTAARAFIDFLSEEFSGTKPSELRKNG